MDKPVFPSWPPDLLAQKIEFHCTNGKESIIYCHFTYLGYKQTPHILVKISLLLTQIKTSSSNLIVMIVYIVARQWHTRISKQPYW